MGETSIFENMLLLIFIVAWIGILYFLGGGGSNNSNYEDVGDAGGY